MWRLKAAVAVAHMSGNKKNYYSRKRKGGREV